MTEFTEDLLEEKQLSEENLNTLEWAISFLNWYEKKYKPKNISTIPLEEQNIRDFDENYYS